MKRKESLRNVPSGHDGSGFITINGRVVPGFLVSKLSVKADTIVSSKRFLGERVSQNAPRGLDITGNLSYYHKTAALMKAIEDYKNGGEYPEITIQSWAEVAKTGRCEVLLTDVILKSIGLGGLDDGSDDATVFDTDITADDFHIISKFNEV